MPKRHLTAVFVGSAKPAPGAAQTDYFDTALPAFGLRAGKRRKTWFCMVRVLRAGTWRLTRISLGTTADLTLAEARQAARVAIEQAQQGNDPSDTRKRRREALEARSRDTFAAVRADFLARYVGRRTKRRPSERTMTELRRALSADVLKDWDARPIAEIDEHDIRVALDLLVARGAPVRANRLLGYLRTFFTWARSQRKIEVNPATDIDRPGAEQSRDRVLSLDELAAIWRATDPADVFGGIVRMLMLTGQRRAEVAGMAWDEIDGDTWTLPAERSKNRRPHMVPLSAPAREIIEKRAGRDRRYVFPSQHGKAYTGFCFGKARLDARAPLAAPWTLHDLRRSFVTHCAERLRIAPHVIEAVVNHQSGVRSGVAGIYNRASYLDERRAALNAWADFLLRIVADNARELRA